MAGVAEVPPADLYLARPWNLVGCVVSHLRLDTRVVVHFNGRWGCYRSDRTRSRPTASLRPTGCRTESMPLSTAHCGRQRHHQPEIAPLDGSSASRLRREERRERPGLRRQPAGPMPDTAHGPDVRRTTRGPRDHEARILAFWASNSASVRTPWDLRSASLASWSALPDVPAVSRTYALNC